MKTKVGRRGYSPELKQQALAKLANGNYTLRALSAELNISVPTLLKWRDGEKASGHQQPQRNAGRLQNAPQDVQSEVERLRREVADLLAERDRLRKGILALAGLSD